MTSLYHSGHQVQTSVADHLGRLWRQALWTRKYLMGCDICPCDPCSAPEPDYVYNITGDEEGHVTEDNLDLSCIPMSEKEPMNRVFIINLKSRDCELNGCEGVRRDERKKVYLTHCNCSVDDTDVNGNCLPVKVYLRNNNVPVTVDEFGNPVPEYFLVGEGELKYLCIVNGLIRRIVN
jgi:hypothetical protein